MGRESRGGRGTPREAQLRVDGDGGEGGVGVVVGVKWGVGGFVGGGVGGVGLPESEEIFEHDPDFCAMAAIAAKQGRKRRESAGQGLNSRLPPCAYREGKKKERRVLDQLAQL